MVTGTTNNSRLLELRKYIVTDMFQLQYISGGTLTNNGVDYNNSISGITVTYYIDGIKYIDNVNALTTTFISPETDISNFTNSQYYKDSNKENIISNPKIIDDVFIDRQELSAFDKNYRLEYIRNLIDLQTYAGGKFFTIIKNTLSQ